ncbi:MAG: hypothetical protein MUC92_06635 [Fimbriimonadaceae bacterium]|jgi:hypothetical protein|nr:hypothetical protein [Fimbriimonadaceae bacterium]
MNWLEILTIGIIVAASLAFLVKTFWGATRGEKGSCKACSSSCLCEEQKEPQKQKPRG